MCSCAFKAISVKYAVNIGLRSDAYGPHSFKLGMMIVITKLYILM